MYIYSVNNFVLFIILRYSLLSIGDTDKALFLHLRIYVIWSIKYGTHSETMFAVKDTY